MIVWYELKIPSLGITVRHQEACRVMPNSYPPDRIFNPHLTDQSGHAYIPIRYVRQIIWAATWQNQQNDCAPSEDSDQPVHSPSLIRVFTVCMKKAWVLSYPLSAQRRLIRLGGCPGWSESSLGADSFCWFCHVAAQLYVAFSSPEPKACTWGYSIERPLSSCSAIVHTLQNLRNHWADRSHMSFEASMKWRNEICSDYPDLDMIQLTVNVLNIRTPQKFVVITLKFELCGSTTE